MRLIRNIIKLRKRKVREEWPEVVMRRSASKKILEFLKKNSDRTVAVADIDHYLRTQDCEVNITTIYRYLDKLAKDGTVIKYVAEKGKSGSIPVRRIGASL